MAMRVLFPEWRRANSTTRYPFAPRSSLTNGVQVILDGVLVDAALYPIGAAAGLYLSTVTVDHENVTLTLAAPGAPNLATGAFVLANPPDEVVFADAYGRPAGILVSEGRQLGLFAAWGVGTFTFLPTQTEFAATVVFPTPEVGVRGILLETGDVFVGDVWLIGGPGVVLRTSAALVPVPGTPDVRAVTQVRLDVVGDPLFRRRLCGSGGFETPRFVTAVKVTDGNGGSVLTTPDGSGTVRLTVSDAVDTVLRIATTPDGLTVSAAGSTM